MKRILLVAAMVLVGALGIGAATLFANTGHLGTVDCSGVNLTFVDFNDKPGNVINLDAYVDGSVVKHTQFMFDGKSGQTKIPLDLSGDHFVQVKGSWNTNGQQGSLDTGLVHIVCTSETETVTVTTPGQTTTVTETVPGPTRTVTTPGPTVTVTTPGQTVTQTLTQTVEAPPVTTTVPGPTVVKTRIVKGKTRILVKWKTRIVWKHKSCTCPLGTRLWHGKCHAIVHGSG